jgi:hypothetical protein
MTAWDVPDGEFFTHPDYPDRCLQKHWNNEAWGSVTATTEELGLLLLRGDMEAVLLPPLHAPGYPCP